MRRSFAILLALPLVLLLPGAPAASDDAARPREVQPGELLPDAPMSGLNGPTRKLTDYRGKPLIINVWASWCGPCRAEMASLERLAWTDASVDLNVIGVSIDDFPERARAFLESSNATIDHFIDERLQLETLLGAARVPLTVLVDADGRVVRKVAGARSWDSPDALRLVERTFGRAPRNEVK